jgi:hypothetical protein
VLLNGQVKGELMLPSSIKDLSIEVKSKTETLNLSQYTKLERVSLYGQVGKLILPPSTKKLSIGGEIDSGNSNTTLEELDLSQCTKLEAVLLNGRVKGELILPESLKILRMQRRAEVQTQVNISRCPELKIMSQCPELRTMYSHGSPIDKNNLNRYFTGGWI